jgi:lipid II:glycine glycyltransferase (peptidoglycan interpeptide bridge formation enzyme)
LDRGKYWIVAIFENEKIIGGSMIIRHKIKKGYSWFYAARGPLLDYASKNIQEQIGAIIKVLSPIAKKEKAIFVRIDPALKAEKFPTIASFKKAHGFQPDDTIILDITKTEEEILAQMKPKGRYNIGLAKKKGVTVQVEKNVEAFCKILNETTTRDKFHGHEKDFYEKMLKTLAVDEKAEVYNGAGLRADGSEGASALLYLAKIEGKIIAGIIATFYKDTAIYYYGASSNEHRETMAPYLLQWTAILDAKARGLKHYDFLGVSPAGAISHPWAGVTEFKKKFGGEFVSYSPAHEYSFKKLHHLAYKALKKLR